MKTKKQEFIEDYGDRIKDYNSPSDVVKAEMIQDLESVISEATSDNLQELLKLRSENETLKQQVGEGLDWHYLPELPPLHKHGMSADVLTIAGTKMSVKCYDHELGRWSGSPYVTVKCWCELPDFPAPYQPQEGTEP